jgi:hypothetical protein
MDTFDDFGGESIGLGCLSDGLKQIVIMQHES